MIFAPAALGLLHGLTPLALGLLHGFTPLALAPMRYVYPAPQRGNKKLVTRKRVNRGNKKRVARNNSQRANLAKLARRYLLRRARRFPASLLASSMSFIFLAKRDWDPPLALVSSILARMAFSSITNSLMIHC